MPYFALQAFRGILTYLAIGECFVTALTHRIRYILRDESSDHVIGIGAKSRARVIASQRAFSKLRLTSFALHFPAVINFSEWTVHVLVSDAAIIGTFGAVASVVIQRVLVVLVAKSWIRVNFERFIRGLIVIIIVIIIVLVISLGWISNTLAIGRIQQVPIFTQLASVTRIAPETSLNGTIAQTTMIVLHCTIRKVLQFAEVCVLASKST